MAKTPTRERGPKPQSSGRGNCPSEVTFLTSAVNVGRGDPFCPPSYVQRSEHLLSEPQFRRLGSTLNQLVPMDWAGRTAGFAPSVVCHHSPANRLVKSRPDRGGFTICPCFSEGLSFSEDDFDDGGPVLLQD